ncbi:FtsX-like permease family protein [Haloactinopolyspora alba]|uniref:FtsX-like permease family protein n=1 Tax=Haloactinopolyspora alba TaxID=648780 RepID=A0A2P8DHF7_9ACTN|nr:FtsX-like permease family protein [Haloactinopolyspora alba]PSK96633.1 FtsX-like permease family protein [Haloactinopolyspora alba]
MFGSARLVRRRATGHLGVSLTAGLTALVTAVLLVSAVVLAPSVAESALERTLDDADAAEASLAGSTGLDGRWTELDEDVRSAAADSGVVGAVTATVIGTAFTLPGTADRTRVAVGYVQDAGSRARLDAGRWPDGGAAAAETVVHRAAADELGLEPGDAIEVRPLTGSAGPVPVTVVGTYEPDAPGHPVWRDYGAGVRPAGGDGFTVLGPLLFDRDDLLDRVVASSATAQWLLPLDTSAVTLGSAGHAADALRGLTSTLSDLRAGEAGQQMAVTGDVAALVERADDAASSTRALLLVVVAMLTVLGVWALAFTARLVAVRRAPATALLRSRGAGERTVLRWSALGTAVPAVLVAVLAPPLADAALDESVLTGSAWAVSVGVAALWLVMMVAADVRAGRSMTGVVADSSRPRRAGAQRAGLDLVLLALGAIALQQLRRPPEEASEVVLVAAPALVVLAGAVVLIRALPWVARAAGAVGSRLAGAAAMLGGQETSRRTTRHVAASVLVVLAVTVSVFAATTQSTWETFRVDGAEVSEPADVRVTTDGAGGESPDENRMLRLPGVEQAMPVVRTEVRTTGDVTVDVVGVDPRRAGTTARWDARLAGGPAGSKLELLGVGDDGTVPALVTSGLAERFGLSTGDATDIDLGGPGRTTVRVAGIVDAVPGTTAPNAMLTDGAALASALDRQRPDEWWLATTDDGRDAATAAADLPGVVDTATHAGARRLALNDPSSAGVGTGLTAGLGFAAVFVLIGVVVHALTSFRARAGEYAVLRAIGLDRRGVAGTVAVEHAVLLGFSTVTGLGLGLVVAWLVVPHAVGGLAGLARSSTVPPLHLDVPWPIVGALAAAVVALTVALIAVQTALTRRLDVAAVLREGGGG